MLKAGIVLAISNHTALASGEGIIDPIITAIRDLRAGEAAFSAIKEDDWHLHGGEDAVIAKTYGPALDVVDEWDRPAETMEGALEALRFAREEADLFSSSPAVPRMISAALVYLEALS
ncbi:hypothetical protein N182_28780 [Sinorhizobium sp. GL2]|nr:hypothetical protein N182_28780 [Sinorhizobium sp. GL2]